MLKEKLHEALFCICLFYLKVDHFSLLQRVSSGITCKGHFILERARHTPSKGDCL